MNNGYRIRVRRHMEPERLIDETEIAYSAFMGRVPCPLRPEERSALEVWSKVREEKEDDET